MPQCERPERSLNAVATDCPQLVNVCLPTLPKPSATRAHFEPDRPGRLRITTENPGSGHTSCPIPPQSDLKRAPMGCPRHGQDKTFWRGNMESRRVTTEQRRERAELDPR